MPTPLVALTVAGVDSAGGAGVHADLRAFAAHGLHGATAVAALTAQSTQAVEAVHVVPPEFVAAQLDAVLGDLDVRATKTGFLASADTVDVVARVAEAGRLANLVVDPVLVSSAGAALFPPDVRDALVARLLPLARVITPNRTEAGLLVGRSLQTLADMEAAAVELLDLGCEAVVVKGGDADDEGDDAVDVVAVDGRAERLVLPRVDTPNDHGSGCSFAAATAARLALGDDPLDAVRAAKGFVHRGLLGARTWRLGGGHGPIDAFGWDS
ncbi:bifunctional hydroxymethylpyrimidine kinase/phosphomethylpyrimidine kinase [Acidimicrobiia bacterium EGI L10123]|uniref:bifunctional hydroxymethylpyrimidine kinase/phosphomethylpyrimidine kinase n=1 Tax=Salinilacustrithrix flava TaxID=2957203 RepID=UPI003D7C29D0|nr:bifunctional hydroxymethylpyrimidine kinase/phosphomethylpyrimidine kinase [Acidimicrobiia bacterium EGI L10123]